MQVIAPWLAVVDHGAIRLTPRFLKLVKNWRRLGRFTIWLVISLMMHDAR